MNDAPAPAFAWCDGELVPAADVLVSAFDRAVLYGLGAFETVRLHGGRPFLLERHLERLERSLAAVGLPRPAAVDALPAGVVALAARCERPSALCRVTVTAGPEPEAALAGHGMRVIAGLRPPPPPGRGRAVVVGTLHWAPAARSPLTGVKSTSYLEHYLIRDRARREGREEDLLIDAAGNVTEGSVSNVFAVVGGRLITPPLSEGILAGVTRGVVLELATEQGLAVEQAPLHVDALARAAECFLTGAGKCLLPVDVLDGRRLPAERPVATRLAAALKRAIARACGVPEEAVDF